MLPPEAKRFLAERGPVLTPEQLELVVAWQQRPGTYLVPEVQEATGLDRRGAIALMVALAGDGCGALHIASYHCKGPEPVDLRSWGDRVTAVCPVCQGARRPREMTYELAVEIGHRNEETHGAAG